MLRLQMLPYIYFTVIRQNIIKMIHETLFAIYYIHTISTTTALYLCHTTDPIPRDYIILRHAIILYYYLILLSYSLQRICTISIYHIILILILHLYIYIYIFYNC